MNRYFNVNDFSKYSGAKKSQLLAEAGLEAFDSAQGRQNRYGVFLSHSTRDQEIIRKIREYLEEVHKISVYIDWDEDEGTNRDEIAETVKKAMNISDKFLVVKTGHSDKSSWVSWETGYFDAKDSNSIGVLLVENEENNFKLATLDFEHQEYLKRYKMLEYGDLVYFLKDGISGVMEYKTKILNEEFANKNVSLAPTAGTIGLHIDSAGKGTSTKFFGK